MNTTLDTRTEAPADLRSGCCVERLVGPQWICLRITGKQLNREVKAKRRGKDAELVGSLRLAKVTLNPQDQGVVPSRYISIGTNSPLPNDQAQTPPP